MPEEADKLTNAENIVTFGNRWKLHEHSACLQHDNVLHPVRCTLDSTLSMLQLALLCQLLSSCASSSVRMCLKHVYAHTPPAYAYLASCLRSSDNRTMSRCAACSTPCPTPVSGLASLRGAEGGNVGGWRAKGADMQ
jgi:hypothetical protein